MGKLDEFARHDGFETVDTGDTVSDRHHEAGLGNVYCFVIIFDFVAEHPRDFICPDLSHA